MARLPKIGGAMPTKVFLADNSTIMRTAIRTILNEEPRISVIGESGNFVETIQMIKSLKPDVLLLDLHMAEERPIPPDLIKVQLNTVCTLAISLANDVDSQELARTIGAIALLDKMTLFQEMVPAILACKSPVA
jgi:chemotaxis response regulator CheB